MPQTATVASFDLRLSNLGASPECEREFAWAAGLRSYELLAAGCGAGLSGRIETAFNELYAMFNGNSITSPIEQRLAAHLVWMDNLEVFGPPKCDELDEMCGEPPPAGHSRFLIKPQSPLGRYRADFLVGLGANSQWRKIVVECDGHNYHERTKEQAAHDRGRDRFLTLNGYKVMRFTGSEIHKDAAACARQVEELALQLAREIS